MGVSLYYTARRDRGLSDAESDRIAKIVAEENEKLNDKLNKSLPGWKKDGVIPSYITDSSEICEGLSLYDLDELTEAGVILEGSSKVSHSDCGAEPMITQLESYTRFALGRLRRALPDAEWEVHVDEQELAWEEEHGEYVFA